MVLGHPPYRTVHLPSDSTQTIGDYKIKMVESEVQVLGSQIQGKIQGQV